MSAGDLWAKAVELERDFAGYKRRLAERRACTAVAVGDAGAGVEAEEEQSAGAEGTGRGRRYEEYVRRRDDRLRQEWRARMELKEAEMKALWARLDRGAGSSSRRAGDAELADASCQHREDYVKQKPGSLEVKGKPIAPVTPRCTPAAKLTRTRSSVPSSPAAASPRLSTLDTRRRPSSHLHRHLPPQAEPPATPRKENRLPPPSSVTAAAAPVTPRPRTTTLSRSRSMIKDRGCSSVRESPRPPRFQPPRTSCDGVSNVKEPPLSPDHDAVVVVQGRPCFSEHAAVLAHLQKARVAVPEPFPHGRSGGNGAEPASSSLPSSKDEPDSSEIAPGGCSADNKCSSDGDVHQSSDKCGSPEITGDSDTEPSYVYIKRDSGEQTPRSSFQLPPAGPGTFPQAELRSEDKENCNFEGTIAGESPIANAEEASRRASSESLYSNVRSSFDTSATNSPLRSPPSCSTDPSPVDDATRPKKNLQEENAEKNPGSSVTVSITVQSPMDAMAGLKRLLTFGKKNGKAVEVATTVVERPPAGDRSMSRGWPVGGSVKARTTASNDAVASDDLGTNYVISPHVRSLQSFTPLSSPAKHELKEAALHAKSPRVHRSFFSLSSFKSRAS